LLRFLIHVLTKPKRTAVVFLLLQIVFASSFMLFIKWTQVRSKEDVYTVGALNYIIAALLITPFFLASEARPLSAGAIWTGGSMGAIYFVAYFFAAYCVRVIGASSTTVVGVLAILFPITLAALIWDEVPNAQQVIGIVLALCALTLIGLKSDSGQHAKYSWVTPLIIILFFLLCGGSRLAQETFKHISQPEQRPTFVFFAFGMAAIPSLIMLWKRRLPISRSELALGTAMGTVNMLQTHLILRCLEYYPGYIVFPVTSAGGIVVTTLVATGLLKERLSFRACTGIGLAVVALFMLQWIPANT
jgi:drug/metabolite transporter (DMT)-like permease